MQWWNDLWLNEGFAKFMEFVSVSITNPELQVVRSPRTRSPWHPSHFRLGPGIYNPKIMGWLLLSDEFGTLPGGFLNNLFYSRSCSYMDLYKCKTEYENVFRMDRQKAVTV